MIRLNILLICRIAGDVINVGLSEYHKDPMLFVKTGKELTQLPDGVLTNELNKEKSVIDPSNRIIKSHE
jgi:hypothetical protein